MPRPRMYSVKEVLEFTVKDIQGPNFVDVKVRGWLRLTSEQREQCIMKLRDLVRQRDEMAQSIAVDANDLEDRLYHVERSRSHTPIAPFDPNDLEHVEQVLRKEREAHEALVGDNARPCYPIELGLDVFNDPGQYKDLFEYWQGESGVNDDSERLIFSLQLERWKKFRQFQQKNRRYYKFHSRFPEFQQKVLERRRRHGLDSGVQLLEEQDKQSKLVDWMEYQDYELREYERLENDFKEAQAQLESRRQALTEAGISAFEGIQELEFASYYSLALQCSGEEGKARKMEKLAERKLRLAEKRLEAAESENLGERVKKATWVALFLKEVESTQIRLGELQRLAEDAKRDLEPFKRWLQARHNEWGEKRLEDLEEAERMIKLEAQSAEFQDRRTKRNELAKKEYEAGFTRFLAEEEVEFVEEGYVAAQLDNFGEIVERAALIKMVHEEVRSAQTQFEQARDSIEKIELKGQVVSALSSIPLTRGKMKRHNILLEWIEQQRREIVGGRADTEKEGNQGQSKRASLRALRNRPVTEPSRLHLRPFHSSRVSKAGKNRPSGLSRDGTKLPLTTGTHWPKREYNLGLSSTPSTGRKSLRKSTRISKPPEKFRPGVT